jgi:trans-aconitate methyltransferase
MTDPREHWNQVYDTKADDEVSWYQRRPLTSLELIEAAAPDPAAAIVDIGAGTSTLVDDLRARGYRDLTVLDVSASAIEKLRKRLGGDGGRVSFIVADITRWDPPRKWDLWHDRAVFHFLVSREEQDAYIGALKKALVPGGTAILATFALDGPEKCSGLPVQRYSAATLAERLGPDFTLVMERPERHVTPRGVTQSFIYAAFRRR